MTPGQRKSMFREAVGYVTLFCLVPFIIWITS